MHVIAVLLIVIFCSSIPVVPSLEQSRGMLYKVNEYTDRYWNGHEWVYILYPLQIESAEAASVIINDCNNTSSDECNDGHVRNGGRSGQVSRTAAVMLVGDDNVRREYRSFVKFPISSLHGKVLKSAELKLIIERSIRNGSLDTSEPFNNPQLGDTLVIHIDDYGTLDASDFNAPSIGYDPGVLIPASINPPSTVSISVKDAMQKDINHARNFTTYMIRTAGGTDGDNRVDRWHFYTRNSGISNAPRIEYTLAFTSDVREIVKLGEYDLLSRQIESARGMIITLHTSDSQTRSMNQSRLLVDLPSTSDTIARTLSSLKLVDDTISIIDSSIRQISLSLPVGDTLNAIDALTRSIDVARLISSPITISDEIARMLDISREALDLFAIADNIGMGFLLRLIDYTQISEVIDSSISYRRLIVDSIDAVVDVVNVYLLFVRALQDSLSASDLANHIINLTIKVLTDGIIVTDEASRLIGFSRTLDEPLSIVDDLSRIISDMGRVLIEPLSTVDILSNVTSFQREIGTLLSIETVRIIDGLDRSIDVVKGIEDSANVLDDLPSVYTGFVRFIDESINVDHALGRVLELTLQLVESFNISDLLNSSIGYLLSIADSVSALVNLIVSSSGTVAGTGTGGGTGGGGAAGGGAAGGGTVLARSTFITVDLSSSNDTLLVEGFLMDREGVIPFNTGLSVTLVDSDTTRAYKSNVEVIDGRYRFAIPIDELFSIIAPNSAEIRIKAIVTFNGVEYYDNNKQGIRYAYLKSSAESSELRLVRGLVFEAPAFKIVPSYTRYSGERLIIIHVENDSDTDIDSLRIVINEGKVIKVKVSRNWKVTVQDDGMGLLLEGVDGHVLKQGKRLTILILKQGQLNYIVTIP